MSTTFLLRLARMPLAILAVALLVTSVVGGESSPEAARFDHFSHPDGSDYFAMSFGPDAVAPVAGPRDIVVLFDTSASQTGPFRVEALDALKDMLGRLSPNDRVRLISADMNAVEMTTGFVEPGSAAMAEALKKLERRTPLGAGDMGKALTAAADGFEADSKAGRAVVYVGEGTSRAKPLGLEEYKALSEKLADARIAVNSYVVGPRPDFHLLGCLAGQTGGRMIEITEEAGRKMAAAADATVVWPSEVDWPEGVTVFPERMPPLRSDRDTVIIGKRTGATGPVSVEMAVASGNGTSVLSWSSVPGDSNEDFNFLPELVAQAELDGGASLPLQGSDSLDAAQAVIGQGVSNLARLARLALASGNLDGASKLADQALRQDPGNLEVLAVKSAVENRRSGDVPAVEAAAPAAVAPAATPAFPPAESGDLVLIGDAPDPVGDEGALLRSFTEDRRLVSQTIQTQVQNAVADGRRQMEVDPVGATEYLKGELSKVQEVPELDPGVRAQLSQSIQSVLRDASRRTLVLQERERVEQERIAMANERRLAAEKLVTREKKVTELMNRFGSLMDEGRYVLAEMTAAKEARAVVPDSPVPLLAALHGRTISYLEPALVLREKRQKGVVDQLYQAERSHVPFPDEPPIVYPDPAVWQELSTRRIKEYASMTLARTGNAEKEIEAALKAPTQLEFVETPLQEVVDYLRDYHRVEIQVDRRALEDVGLDPSIIPITKALKGISLRSALKLTLRDLDLTYMIEDEVLLITTPEEAENRLQNKVYPVADLVLPAGSGMSRGYGMGGMGMMGGMGGMGMMGMPGMMGGMGMGMGNMGMGMGNMGMGNMGMGMGNMGMGMGNMGMGNMGMGMWNIAPEEVPAQVEDGFRAFSVKDELPVAADEDPAVSSEPIQVKIVADADPEAVWEEYFSTHNPSAEAVLDAIERLYKDTSLDQNVQFNHIIALIGAALRHGQPQPWMYQGLATVMQAQGRPGEEIERVVMSAIDFAQTPGDVMYIGVYLARLGEDATDDVLSRRALATFRQVAEMRPSWSEPYMWGLKTAQQLEDTEGIKWATVGILGQAFSGEQAEAWSHGYRVAGATLEKLRAEGRTSEADAYEAALDDAIARDCVVRVSWIGEADVDLLVEEPAGSVCSLRNPRSAGGGVILGDTLERSDDGYQEVYSCPKGFSGTYRVLVKRVWGKVAGGKLKVEAISHCGTKDERKVTDYVVLKDDQAVVEFDLDGGRREESLEEYQLANAASVQLAASRQILAQQLAEEADTGTISNMLASRSLTDGTDGQGNGFVPFPFQLAGAVGYSPVIQTLSEGASCSASAVISADRRYVRITPMPSFSGIGEVNTFNFANGESGTSGGGTGGSGYSGMGNTGMGSGMGMF